MSRYCAQCGEDIPVVAGRGYCDSCIQSLISDTCGVDDLETENINLRRQNAKLEAALRECAQALKTGMGYATPTDETCAGKAINRAMEVLK